MSNTWMVRAGEGASEVDAFVKQGVVALGWPETGALGPDVKKDFLLARMKEKYPDAKDGARLVWASQLIRFVSELKPGDHVLTGDPERRIYHYGQISSEYQWDLKAIPLMPHVHRVTWTHEVARDVLSTDTRNSLGSIATLFKINADVAKDIEGHLAAPGKASDGLAVPAAAANADGELEKEAEDAFSRADGLIEDAINALGWDKMQDLVAGILRAMGYRTEVSAPGADRGRDIFASPDGLGLQEPRIFVQVKHRTSTKMSAGDIREFLGGRKQGDRCLYVSTGGFAKDAHYEADRSNIPIKLIKLDDLRRLVVEWYEKLDDATRALVPLKRYYWPVGR
jgi:restriction system protein